MELPSEVSKSNHDSTPAIRPNRPSPTEQIDDFLARLPPSTTKATTAGPWIYISGPLPTPKPDIATLVREGTHLLRAYEDEAAILRANDNTSELTSLRETLERQIFALARETGVISGKWMLFAPPAVVDRWWALVARATAEGELGFGAKVATDDGGTWGGGGGGGRSGSGKTRLIAVYTRDYADREDVGRVLGRLVALGMVFVDGRPVYYKCDAFTYLGIMGRNSYGLRASLFSSGDVLGGN
ncbi:DUF1917-domain-containing protein [Aspergillus campestris IBT 28561]|uniref:DUF1917-domain-containing protein n=1 Tax=Aspergillus campestris (strain IBT 28561) TaxID=1392248 RepID=A0A2I1DDX4_ASPC2|nr:DUF1917-domain-containing protein [Aspergillus campestris IBT 28561]PKY08064.1 DUF1917-domain-containing protein [Aspergillus campestris IBT 28561]